MFSKAFNFSSNKKDVSHSKLAKLLQDSEETPVDNSLKNSSIKRNNSNNINEIMNKIDNDKMNTSEISIKNAKLNNTSFIDLNDENEDNVVDKVDFKDAVKNEMKKFVFQIIKDNSSDDYEFKTFYIKREPPINVNKKNQDSDKNGNIRNTKENYVKKETGKNYLN